MTTLLLVVCFVAYLAALGRACIPRHDRLPVRSWSGHDLTANVVRGARSTYELDRRHRRLERTLDELAPRR